MKKLNAVVMSALIILPTLSGLPLILSSTANAVSAGDVWITAAMANPAGTESHGEYIVIKSQSPFSFSMDGWTLSDHSGSTTLSGTIAGSSIPGGGASYKICRDMSASSTATNCDAEWTDMSLLNSGDTLTLSDGSMEIDQVSYSSSHDGVENEFSHSPIYRFWELANLEFAGFPTTAEVGTWYDFTGALNQVRPSTDKVQIRITLNPGTTKNDFILQQRVGSSWQSLIFPSNSITIGPRGGFVVTDLSSQYRVKFNNTGTFSSTAELVDVTTNDVRNNERLTTTVTDLTAPAAPTNLSWQTDSGKTISDGGITNEYSGTAIWQDGTPSDETSDVDHYIYKYWNDIPGNQYKPGHEWPTTDGLTVFGNSREGDFTEGEGVHHFCVAAVDAAGNESSCTEFTITYDATTPTIGEIKVIAPNGDTMQNVPRYNPWKVITTGNNDENGIAGVYAYVYRQDGANWTRLDPEIELGTPGQHVHYFEQGSTNLDYWVSSKNAGNFKDGHTYRLVVWAKDKAGNESDHTDNLTVPNSAVDSASYFSPAFTIDHTAPKVLLNTPNNGSTIQGLVSIKGTIVETNPGHYYLRIEDESGHVVYQKTYYNNPQTFTDYSIYNWDTSVIADGNYTIYLEARDAANNKDGNRAVPGDSVAVSHVMVDNTGPNMGADDNSNLGNTDTSGGTSDSGSGDSQTGGGGSSGPSSLAVILTPLSDGVAGVLGSVASSLGLPGVLGTSTTQGNAGSTDGSNNSSNDSGVKGDSVNRGSVLGDATKDDSCFNILGICWYWWIPVVIIVIAIIYYLSRGKGKKAQNTSA